MRNLTFILLLIVGLGVSACGNSPNLEQGVEEALPAVPASHDGVEATREKVDQAEGSSLPSQSKSAFPHAPGLSHVSVFSVYLTGTEPSNQ